jgi:hypothetical protein
MTKYHVCLACSTVPLTILCDTAPVWNEAPTSSRSPYGIRYTEVIVNDKKDSAMDSVTSNIQSCINPTQPIITAQLCSTPTRGAHKKFVDGRYKEQDSLPPTFVLVDEHFDGQCSKTVNQSSDAHGHALGWAVLDSGKQPQCRPYKCLVISRSDVQLSWDNKFGKKQWGLASSILSHYQDVKEAMRKPQHAEFALWDTASSVRSHYKIFKETMHGHWYLETVYVLLLQETRTKGCYNELV